MKPQVFLIALATLAACAPKQQQQPPARGCDAPKPKPAPRVAVASRVDLCTPADLEELDAVAALAATGLIASGACDGVTVEECKPLQRLAVALGRLATRACFGGIAQ